MNYFNRRNNYQVEYSGHEDVSLNLRKRLISVVRNYTQIYKTSYSTSRPSRVYHNKLTYAVQKELPSEDPVSIIERGEFYEVFTVLEIFWEMLGAIHYQNCLTAQSEIIQAFSLSGSVYGINSEKGHVELVVEDDLAQKLKQTEVVLVSYEHAHKIFFEAVGNLFGRKAKPKDVVRDVFVAAEEYLKNITGESQFSLSIKKLNKQNNINDEQKNILEKLYAFRSNTKGTTHAGDKNEVSEIEAVWFVDTMSAQLRYINNKTKE